MNVVVENLLDIGILVLGFSLLFDSLYDYKRFIKKGMCKGKYVEITTVEMYLKKRKIPKLKPNTIEQLRSLIDNSKSFITNKDDCDIWVDDVEALKNAIEILVNIEELESESDE
jgi:hypothetical protein